MAGMAGIIEVLGVLFGHRLPSVSWLSGLRCVPNSTRNKDQPLGFAQCARSWKGGTRWVPISTGLAGSSGGAALSESALIRYSCYNKLFPIRKEMLRDTYAT